MCTTNMYTHVYPDGRKESSRRPTLCSSSRHGIPCANNVVFQHPPQYVPYPGEPSSAPTTSSPYLSAQFPPTPSYTPRSATPNYRSGDESDRSAGYRSSSSTRSKSKRPPAVYINGQKVYDLDRDPRRERIVLVDGPPTPRTPPKSHGFPNTAPPSPSTPYIVDANSRRGSSSSSSRRPVIVDERPRVEIDIGDNHNRPSASRHTRHTSTSSHESGRDDESTRRRRREHEAAQEQRRQAQRDTRIRDRIAQANAEIANRPPVPMAPQPPKRSPTNAAPAGRSYSREREAELVDDVRRMDLKDEERRQRRRDKEREVEDEAQRRRLMERMMPRRRATVGPGSRRHRVLYDDGMYRWE